MKIKVNIQITLVDRSFPIIAAEIGTRRVAMNTQYRKKAQKTKIKPKTLTIKQTNETKGKYNGSCNIACLQVFHYNVIKRFNISMSQALSCTKTKMFCLITYP